MGHYQTRFRLACAVAGVLCTITSARAQIPTTPNATPEYSTPLGIAMEEYPYPFPVRYLPLEIEGEPVRMAYMDSQSRRIPIVTGIPEPGTLFDSRGIPIVTGIPELGTLFNSKRTILLLHGKNFYGSYWENTIRALNGAGYRVIVPDQIGFGKSSKPDINYSFDLLAENTLKLLDTLKIDKVAVVGHSMGGMLAVRFTRNYPQRVTHLVLENPIGLEDYRFKVPPQTTQAQYESELNNTDAAKHRAFLKRYFVQWKPEYERFIEVRTRITHSGEYPRWARASALTYQMIYQQPVRHEFSLLRVPTLLVIGQEDRTTLGRGTVSEEVLQTLGQYPQLGKAAARDVPDSKLVELPNIGHIPHLEAPDKFHAELLEFLKQRPRTP